MNDVFIRKEKITRVLIRSRFVKVTLSIEGDKLSQRIRRQIALAILRDISPKIRNICDFTLRHEDGDFLWWLHHRRRNISFRQSIPLDHPAGRLGFVIRMKRLELDWTQAELGLRTGIDASYLSLVERGRTRPGPRVLLRLQNALGIALLDLRKPIPQPPPPALIADLEGDRTMI